MTVRCSLVIRAFNEEKHIGRLLEGVREQTVDDVEIIIVDSGSTDRTVEIAEKFGARVVYIHPREFTFGRSLNMGIAATKQDLVVIASAHVFPVYPDWLERLLEPFADPKIALSYGKQRGGEATKFSEHQVFMQWYREHSDSRQAHPFSNNANAAIRRSLWEQHPFDETLTGLEDLSWANWAMHAGHAIAYVAEAEVIHIHNETPRGVFNRYRREAMAFKRIFPLEHFGILDFLRLVVVNIFNDIWHAFQAGVLKKSFSSILWFRWMQFWGTYQGYRQSGPLTWQLRQTFYYPRGLGMASEKRQRDVEPIRYNQEN